ncbi:hypothetical protein ASF11_00915 [Acidovorax sp. Leaf76]|uniref:hypothetical protein n=1 Tax=unclassified Acidovorax TaxID=2684926 RepID=UPI0006F6A23E|nr:MULTISPECIES: hypothetical protein [unclassified Acidovorax]KQO26308.1 hypothetical protein ASF11_00915 [Acidovorax sp. Leaf76]KQO35903.1 hypothetical protein ASF19_22720 [Acidovorax sp. Leaf84]KQS38328.1 hypothetical protein ASG27_23420 [Acidovorax sp. Leaf191]
MPSEKKPKPEADDLPSPEQFCLAVPLYDPYRFDYESSGGFFSIEHFKGTLDFFCPECGSHSVFRLAREAKYQDTSHARNHIFSLPFVCSRDGSHRADFIFRAHKGVIQKIGQSPSLADIATPDLKKYRPVLGQERHRELVRGVGLATHGVGVGAFVYLRRVFEWLIDQARLAASAEPDWSDDAYIRARMEERITLLANYLPDFLVKNRGLYGILSVGVHTLTEKQCLDAFPAVKLAIELTLDDLLKAHERNEKLKAAAKALEALKGTVGKPEA